MNLNFEELAKRIISLLQNHKMIALLIKGSPDPDAIASSYFFYTICERLGIGATLFSFMPPSLPQNKKLIEYLQIELREINDIQLLLKNSYSGYIVCDYATAALNAAITIPCILHIDHHTPVQHDVPAQLRILTDEVFSTSTLCALMMPYIHLFHEADLKKLATALYLGIKTDTDGFRFIGIYDEKAMYYLQQMYDSAFVEKLEHMPLSPFTTKLLYRAISNAFIYKDWLITGIGFIDEHYRDAIAIIADYLLQQYDVELVVVYAAVYHNRRQKLDIDASLRTSNKNFNLNELIQNITSDGGGRKFKGAYQVHIDYFAHCPDEEKLWELIQITTVHIFKNLRDKSFTLSIQGVYKKISHFIKRTLWLE